MGNKEHKFSIEKDEEGVHSVSTAVHDYLDDKGYKTVTTRKQLVTKPYLEKAISEEFDADISILQGNIDELNSKIDQIQDSHAKDFEDPRFIQFKKDIKKHEKTFLKLQKKIKLINIENQLKQLLNQLENATTQKSMLLDARKHYEEILVNHLGGVLPEKKSKEVEPAGEEK